MSTPKVFAYYFPSWHLDPRNARWFGQGWSEWQLLQDAVPRFPGHRQPRIPAGGYTDEADPRQMAEQIRLASENGITGFMFDWYWYDDGGYLSRALEEGFLQAENSSDLEFAIMWANHNLTDIFPARGVDTSLLRQGPIDRAAFERLVDHVVTSYFSQPNYLRVEGKPFFSIYEMATLVKGLGGLEATRDALRYFDEKTREAGHPGLHLNGVIWTAALLPGAAVVSEPERLIGELGFDSATSYVWIHHLDYETSSFPVGDWDDAAEQAFAAYRRYAATLDVPFYPNVTVGWDSTPRVAPGFPFEPGGYPRLPVFDGTPEQFTAGLERAKRFLEETAPSEPMVFINAWNEWTEGSYLLPDTVNGERFLHAVKNVFPPVR